MARAPRSEDLYQLRVPTDLRLSPEGRRVAFVVKSVAPTHDGYRNALWLVDVDGATPARQLTLGARHDTAPRWSPDGRWLAFLSDRSAVLQEAGAGDRPAPREAPREGGTQVWLLPLEGGEARQLTRLPKDVTDIAWSPDGTRLCVVSAATDTALPAPARRPEDPPLPDARFMDRLYYMLNDSGFTYDRPGKLWRVDVASGEAVRLTSGAADDGSPAWSPDGTRIAFCSARHRDHDLTWRSDVFLVPAEGGARPIQVTSGRGEYAFWGPTWSPDGAWLAVKGHRPTRPGVRSDVWRFRPLELDAGEDLTAASDLFVDAGMNSDLVGGTDSRLHWSGDGRWITFTAPVEGSFEAWRVEVETRRVERLTRGRHWFQALDQVTLPRGGARLAAACVTATTPLDVVTLEAPAGALRGETALEVRRLTDLMGSAWAGIELVEPQERWHEVDGRRIQGWFLPARGVQAGRTGPLVVEIHGGPATLYGWSLMWEWQVLVAQGMSVYACNPRGSQGYGEAFCAANYGDWGTGPMADVMAGVEALVEDGLADPAHLGVTGGSYGGYLTSWIVGHTDRFAAAVTCRSVNDMTSQMLTGDIAGPQFGRFEYGRNPWQDPQLYLRESPLTYADRIHTPLLIQHAERDLRTPIGQAEELFTVLRSMRRPVRLYRVPDESHELTRSGTPFRRVYNVDTIAAWFEHFLVRGRRRLPPVPKHHPSPNPVKPA